MERGLLWLPLLGVFFWLAWTGWNEYQKIEAYRLWSENFEQAKYDIYAVLGYRDQKLTWGKPTREEPQNLRTVSLDSIKEIRLLVNDKLVAPEGLPKKGEPVLELTLDEEESSARIPFTEIDLASKWLKYLQERLSEKTEKFE